MKNINEISEKIEESKQPIDKKRKVTFAPGVMDYERPITYYQKTKKQPNYAGMKHKVLNYLNDDKYEELESYLNLYSNNEINEFISRQGSLIIRHAIQSPNTKSLDFLTNKLPITSMQNTLRSNNFSILKDFLCAQQKLEEFGLYNEIKKELRIKKFLFFLQIDNENTQDFMKCNNNEYYMTKVVKEDFKSALFEFQQKHQIKFI